MKLLAAAVFMLVAACSRKEPEPAPKPDFQVFMETGLINRPPCSTIIPINWSASYPVPVLIGGKLHYRAFFRGWEGNPKEGIKIHDAEGDVLFSPDGKVLECTQRGKPPRAYPVEPSGIPDSEYDARLRALYVSIEEMARLYAKGMPVGDADRARVKAFAAEFRLFAGKDLAASHRALSPEFWAWVQKNGGTPP